MNDLSDTEKLSSLLEIISELRQGEQSKKTKQKGYDKKFKDSLTKEQYKEKIAAYNKRYYDAKQAIKLLNLVFLIDSPEKQAAAAPIISQDAVDSLGHHSSSPSGLENSIIGR